MSETLTAELLSIQIGQEFPFFLGKTPSVSPISSDNPKEVLVFQEVIIEGRKAVIYNGIRRRTTSEGIEVCSPFVVINYDQPSWQDRTLKATLKVAGVEYTSDGNGHPDSPFVRTTNDPHFFFFTLNGEILGNFLRFEPPIPSQALNNAMSLTLQSPTVNRI